MTGVMLASSPYIARGPRAAIQMMNFWTPMTIITTSICVILCYVLLVIAWWKLFTKAGEKGWKSLIPFYNFYVQCKLTWNTKFFWIMLVAGIIDGIFYPFYFTFDMIPSMVGTIIIFVFILIIAILAILSVYWLARAFGYGIGFTIGLVFLSFIFMLILGFGSSKYKGNVYLKSKGK